MDITLLHSFEQALLNICNVLEYSKKEYNTLFSSMIAGEYIGKELQSNTCNEHIVQAWQKLRIIQEKITKVLLQNSESMDFEEKKVLSLTDISRKIEGQWTIDVISIAKKSTYLYEEIKNIISGIEKYYEYKITEYRDFFDKIYEDLYTNKNYIQDKKNSDHSGLLVYKNA